MRETLSAFIAKRRPYSYITTNTDNHYLKASPHNGRDSQTSRRR